MIFISHKLEEIFTVCDRVTVFRDGQFIAVRDCAGLQMQELITMIVGRELDNMYPKQPAEIGKTVLEVKNLTSPGIFQDVSFSVKSGEILGLCGLMGAGRTEIIRAIFGIDTHSKGEILLDGKPVKISSPAAAVEHGFGMVTEDRLRMGIIPTMSVLANTTIAFFYRLCNRLGFYRKKQEIERFGKVREELSIKCASSSQLISQLSGGNQQKVILARWLLTNPRVLFLDEPTRGIDVGSKAEIHRLISGLAQQGLAIVLVSSEMPEILGMSDRIMVVRHGQIVHECMPKTTTQEKLISYAFGSSAE